MTAPPDPPVGPDASRVDARKEALRLSRRVERLEMTLRQVEDIRDTNARLLDRLMVELAAERARSESLLLNVLPQRIVDRLNAGEQRIADRHDDVAVVFSDFVGFTGIAGRLAVADLVDELGGLFSSFDAAADRFGVEKIKTIGDAYLAVAGLAPLAGGDQREPAAAAADMAIAMLDAVAAAGAPWQVRIGIDVGPVVAGVIGTRTFAYDVWGDTVNVASRLESASEPGRIHVSDAVAAALAPLFALEPRGEITLKGKDSAPTWFLVGRRATTSAPDRAGQRMTNVATIATSGGSAWTIAACTNRRLVASRMIPAPTMQAQQNSTIARPATSSPAAIRATPAATPIARNRL